MSLSLPLLFSIVFSLAGFELVYAQKPDPQSREEQVEVVSSDWKYAGYTKVEVISDGAGGKQTGYGVKRNDAFGFKYTAVAVLRNSSSATITEVNWAVIFTDKETHKEVRRFRIKSKQEFPPGQMIEFSKVFFVDTNLDLKSLDNASRQTVIENVSLATR